MAQTSSTKTKCKTNNMGAGGGNNFDGDGRDENNIIGGDSSSSGTSQGFPQLSSNCIQLTGPASTWTESDVFAYLTSKGHNEVYVKRISLEHNIDGKALLMLTESDLRDIVGVKSLGDLKRFLFDIVQLQEEQRRLNLQQQERISQASNFCFSSQKGGRKRRYYRNRRRVTFESTDESQLSDDDDQDIDDDGENLDDSSPRENNASTETGGSHSIFGSEPVLDRSPPLSTTGVPHHRSGASNGFDSSRRTSTGYAIHLKPELFKAIVAMAYLFVVTWITALVMVIVHDRVPDMEKYPPLPDLFLDNMPHIPWAFEMCEVTGTILFCLWIGVLFFHKHRFILIRRFFALSGTVFLLRCVTMLITSLSVPGTHLKCNPRPYGDWMSRLYNAYLIWKGAGMSIQGVRTCGDYMFSGHTVALTMLNFFVTEYTTRRLYFIHTFSWLLNMFGIFFILAAHEHYSIDVFIAFYITSRLFLYYHTLANNQALMQRDSKRTKVWFPLFSYFESGVDGIVPNCYEWPITPRRVKKLIKTLSLTVERKYKGKFFTREGTSRGFGFFRTKVNAFIRPVIRNSGGGGREKGQ